MFKIAFIGQKGIPVSQGGVERHVEELSVRLAKNGHEVFVYTRPHWVPAEYKKYEKVNLISLPSFKTKNLDAISHTLISTLSAIFRERVDIIHYQGVGPSLLAWLPRILNPKIKIVATVHSADWNHQKWNFFARLMLRLGANFACRFAHETIAVGRELQKHCLVKHNADATYIPNGVGRPLEDPENPNNVLENFKLIPNQYLLVVSRLVKHKGVHYLIDAFKKVKDHSKDQNLKLVIVGSTAFTEDYQQFLYKLTEHRDDIIFTGIQTGANLDSLFRHAYLYCQPSESEGLSLSVLEAMSYGKTVLLSDIPENIQIITGNSSTGSVGFDFKNKDILDLTSKIELLLNNPKIVNEVGAKARHYVNLYFNWEEIVARTEKIYKNIVLIKDKLPSRLRLALNKYIF